jgi:hypothetical protein
MISQSIYERFTASLTTSISGQVSKPLVLERTTLCFGPYRTEEPGE